CNIPVGAVNSGVDPYAEGKVSQMCKIDQFERVIDKSKILKGMCSDVF
ncbi:MAG: hypothetical protein ACJAYC_000551, partial [Halieaceae bacterium]